MRYFSIAAFSLLLAQGNAWVQQLPLSSPAKSFSGARSQLLRPKFSNIVRSKQSAIVLLALDLDESSGTPDKILNVTSQEVDSIESNFALGDAEKVDPVIESGKEGWRKTARLATLFFLWYVLNIGYNIGNKRVLNALPVPWSAATVELFFGFPYVAMLWLTGLRKAPKLSFDNIKTLSSQAFFLAATHVAGVISFSAGAISFTHILKATEPVWSALILAVGFKEFLPLPVYISLIPIIGGVGLASLKELSFTWLSFTAGTVSAVTSATKAILSKKVLDGKPLGENLTPANMFAVLTILGFLFILPASLLIEGPAKVSVAWTAALAAGYTKVQLFRLLSISGFLYYLYNEVAFLALSEVAPVTHAVTNTVKRVVIIMASVLVFRNPISPLGMVGSGLAIAGATAYSIAKNKCTPKTQQ